MSLPVAVPPAPPREEAPPRLAFDAVYEAHFPFVWRTVRRLGVDEASRDDVTQEVFVVVHRRLPSFEGRSSLKTWIFGIALRVVRDHRRTRRRKPGGVDGDALDAIADGAPTPDQQVEKSQAVRLLHALLDSLDDDQREVFVLAELEQLTAPEIAEVTGANVNTVYARLRAARKDFEAAVARYRARERSRR